MEEYMLPSGLMNSLGAEGANLPTLPNDLMIDILIRLPVKSLCQFKCVSKPWCSLIQSPAFIKIKKDDKMLLMRHFMEPHNMLSFHDLSSGEMEELKPSFYIPLDPIEQSGELKCLLGPCNGLVSLMGHLEGKDRIVICNPTSKEFKHLPLYPFECPQDHLGLMYAEGFGYSFKTNDFKIVLIRYVFDPEDRWQQVVQHYLLVHLYSTSTNSWKLIDYHGSVYPCGYSHNRAGVFLHGSFHWHATTFEKSELIMILCFDINNENFNVMEYPDCVTGAMAWGRTLTLRNECLTLIEHKTLKNQSYVVWVMTEYGVKSSWVKQFVVRTEVDMLPLYWINDNCILMEKKQTGGLACLDFMTNKIQKFNVYWKSYSSQVIIYEESLISLNQLIKFA